MIGAQTPEYDTPIERIATPMSDEPIQEEEGLVSHKPKQKHEKAHPRDLIAFFICGLMNNFGYVIFLTAAEDLVSGYTGVVLLCEIVPSLIMQIIAPFFMHLIPYNLRVFILFLLACLAFQVVAWFSDIYAKLAGVILASIACGGGEITFLAMSSYYHKNTVSAWSSGTGGAGIVGSLSYLVLKGWLGLTPKQVLLICTPLNLLLILSSYFLMTGKHALGGFCARGSGKVQVESEHHVPLTMMERLRYVPFLLRYMIPLLVVYFSEYLINQSLFPNLKFRLGLIAIEDQYVYYQFTYQVGVFVSRSSVNFFPIKRLWLPAVLQCINFVILFIDAYFRIIPAIWFIIPIIFFEGLMGGATYVNAFYLLSAQVDDKYKEFSLGLTSVANSVGISLCAVTAIFLQPWMRAHQHHKYI